jgi:signal peptidase I
LGNITPDEDVLIIGMFRLTGKILQWLGWALLGLLFFIAAFVLWGSKNGWEFDAILSGSMEPTFHVGGLVVVKPVNALMLKVGDPISFKIPNVNTPICHRIIAIQQVKGQEYLQTKGDANEEADQNLVPVTSVSGKVLLHIPYVGRLLDIKTLGSNKINVLGKQLPVATLLVLVMGLLFIGLIFKETLEDTLWPSKRWSREMIKAQNARLLKRKQAYKIR